MLRVPNQLDMPSTTMVIADSVDSCREQLEGFLLKNPNTFQLLHTADNAQAVLNTARQYQPQLVVFDVDLPGMCPMELCGQVLHHCPNTRIIARATHDIVYHARQMVKAGARGILSKVACNDEMRHCFNWVHGGNLHLPAECSHLQLSKFTGYREFEEFQLKVLLQLCLRKTLKQIADELYAHMSTVRRAKDVITSIIGTNDSGLIMRWAFVHGYISLKECWKL